MSSKSKPPYIQPITGEEERRIHEGIAEDPDAFINTEAELAQFRRATEVAPELVAGHRPRGRPRGANKTPTHNMLDNDGIAFFKGDNPKGWQTRLNAALRKVMEG